MHGSAPVTGLAALPVQKKNEPSGQIGKKRGDPPYRRVHPGLEGLRVNPEGQKDPVNHEGKDGEGGCGLQIEFAARDRLSAADKINFSAARLVRQVREQIVFLLPVLLFLKGTILHLLLRLFVDSEQFFRGFQPTAVQQAEMQVRIRRIREITILAIRFLHKVQRTFL